MARSLRMALATRGQLLAALAIGLLSCLLCLALRLLGGGGAGDFSWSLSLAQTVLEGRQPYHPQRPYATIPYPLTAVFFGFPLLWLPRVVAAALFFGCSSALLAYGILRAGPRWRLLVFLSPSYLYALAFTQWQPLLLAMLFFPALLGLVVVKPHMALPLLLSGWVRWTWQGAALAAALLLGSLAIDPTWPWRWLPLLRLYQGLEPPLLTLPLGPLLLAAALRWRRREARLLLLLAAMPQRMWYDQLALWMVPRSCRELVALTITGWAGALCWLLTGDFQLSAGDWQLWILLSIYLPALLCVLRRGKDDHALASAVIE